MGEEKSPESFELVVQGLGKHSSSKGQLREVLQAHCEFSIEETDELLSSTPFTVKRADDSGKLEVLFKRLRAAGADVLVVGPEGDSVNMEADESLKSATSLGLDDSLWEGDQDNSKDALVEDVGEVEPLELGFSLEKDADVKEAGAEEQDVKKSTHVDISLAEGDSNNGEEEEFSLEIREVEQAELIDSASQSQELEEESISELDFGDGGVAENEVPETQEKQELTAEDLVEKPSAPSPSESTDLSKLLADRIKKPEQVAPSDAAPAQEKQKADLGLSLDDDGDDKGVELSLELEESEVGPVEITEKQEVEAAESTPAAASIEVSSNPEGEADKPEELEEPKSDLGFTLELEGESDDDQSDGSKAEKVEEQATKSEELSLDETPKEEEPTAPEEFSLELQEVEQVELIDSSVQYNEPDDNDYSIDMASGGDDETPALSLDEDESTQEEPKTVEDKKEAAAEEPQEPVEAAASSSLGLELDEEVESASDESKEKEPETKASEEVSSAPDPGSMFELDSEDEEDVSTEEVEAAAETVPKTAEETEDAEAGSLQKPVGAPPKLGALRSVATTADQAEKTEEDDEIVSDGEQEETVAEAAEQKEEEAPTSKKAKAKKSSKKNFAMLGGLAILLLGGVNLMLFGGLGSSTKPTMVIEGPAKVIASQEEPIRVPDRPDDVGPKKGTAKDPASDAGSSVVLPEGPIKWEGKVETRMYKLYISILSDGDQVLDALVRLASEPPVELSPEQLVSGVQLPPWVRRLEANKMSFEQKGKKQSWFGTTQAKVYVEHIDRRRRFTADLVLEIPKVENPNTRKVYLNMRKNIPEFEKKGEFHLVPVDFDRFEFFVEKEMTLIRDGVNPDDIAKTTDEASETTEAASVSPVEASKAQEAPAPQAEAQVAEPAPESPAAE